MMINLQRNTQGSDISRTPSPFPPKAVGRAFFQAFMNVRAQDVSSNVDIMQYCRWNDNFQTNKIKCMLFAINCTEIPEAIRQFMMLRVTMRMNMRKKKGI